MKPRISYRIWFSPRTGSSLLCKGLEETGIAGKPGEFFTLFEYTSICQKYNVSTYNELKENLWKEGTSSNGVFGIKIVHDVSVFEEIKGLKNRITNNGSNFMDDIFPNCKDIYITRRNKVRQAVSWWKAIQDNVWHIESGKKKSKNDKKFYQDQYDFAALSHLFKEATLRECAIQEYFTKNKITPFTVVYEDLVVDFENTIRKIVRYLELEYSDLHIKEMYFEKTADTDSEQWVQKFRNELQKEMDKKAW